ncbi:MAG: methionyl-tRNA formyltransferase [Rhodobacteraceae bacterium]|nr:methionyl-tRNA formyltransferase [Paracoccaceae bacterium]MYI91692.1 methionyl-tRNA formyltransferase [Paracoccaceae bacterium]
MNKSKRIVMMGSSQFAIPTLELLLQRGYEIIAVYTQPPRSANRGKKITPTPIHEVAVKNDLKVFTPLDFSDEDSIRQFESLEPDVAVVVSYGLILPGSLLDIPRFGFLNIHPSLLPRWRGAAPIQRALIEGDNKTGLSIIKVTEKLDAGPIFLKEEMEIDQGITASELSDELAVKGADLLCRVMDNLETINPAEQSHTGISYAKKIDKTETRIDWNLPAEEVYNKIHGLSYQPGAWFEHRGVRIKILKCELIARNGKPGQVLDQDMTLSCLKGSIRPTLIQRQGKTPMNLKDFLRGYKLEIGEKLS